MEKTLKCFYDLHVSPSTYDFFTFLISAEICRVRRKFSKIIIFIFKGPDQGFRQDTKNRSYDHNLTFLQNVILPGISLLSSCDGYFWCDRYLFSNLKFQENEIFPRGYTPQKPIAEYVGRELVTSQIRGDNTGYFLAPFHMKQKAELYLKNYFNDKKIITLSTRELKRGDPHGFRSINKDVWEKLDYRLNKQNYKLLIIRDTEKAFNQKRLIKKIPEIQLASLSILFRLAVYETSFLNFTKNNGPAVLMLYGKMNTIYFNKFDNDFIATSENWYHNNYGMISGSNFPMTTENKIVNWEEENLDEIINYIKKFEKNEMNNKKVHNFKNVQHLQQSITVSFNHLVECLKHNVLKEDLDLIYSLKKLESKKVIQNDIMDLLKNLEGNILKKGTVDCLFEMDKKNLNIL